VKVLETFVTAIAAPSMIFVYEGLKHDMIRISTCRHL